VAFAFVIFAKKLHSNGNDFSLTLLPLSVTILAMKLSKFLIQVKVYCTIFILLLYFVHDLCNRSTIQSEPKSVKK